MGLPCITVHCLWICENIHDKILGWGKRVSRIKQVFLTLSTIISGANCWTHCCPRAHCIKWAWTTITNGQLYWVVEMPLSLETDIPLSQGENWRPGWVPSVPALSENWAGCQGGQHVLFSLNPMEQGFPNFTGIRSNWGTCYKCQLPGATPQTDYAVVGGSGNMHLWKAPRLWCMWTIIWKISQMQRKTQDFIRNPQAWATNYSGLGSIQKGGISQESESERAEGSQPEVLGRVQVITGNQNGNSQ